MCRIFVLTFSLFLYLFSGKLYAASLYDTVTKGNQFYQDGKFEEALKTFVDGQIEHADDAKLKYNIASSHYKMKNYDEAVKGYLDVAATAKDGKLAEKALYNCGNALFRQGKLEEAIAYYQKALELDPNDQDAKHNLEFSREELRRRINEAKETEKKQQEQQQQQDQKQQDQEKQQDQKQQQEKQENQGQQQDQNKQQEQQQQQEAQPQGQKQEEQQQKAGEEKKEQQYQAGEQKQAEQQPAQGQAGAPENKQAEKSAEAQAVPQQARPMTREEAQQWLNSIEENREKFVKKRAREGISKQYRPEKDW